MEPTIYNPGAYKTPGVYKDAGGIYKGRGVYNASGNGNILLDTICDTCLDDYDIPIIGESKKFYEYEFLNPGYKFYGSSRTIYDNLNDVKKISITFSGSNNISASYSFRTPFNPCLACFDNNAPLVNFRNKLAIWYDKTELHNFTTNFYYESISNERFFLLGNSTDVKEVNFVYEENKLKITCEDKYLDIDIIDTSFFTNSIWLKKFSAPGGNIFLYKVYAEK